MKIRFTGTLDELKSALSPIEKDDSGWVTLNENQIQFRRRSGGVLNWFPSTGAVSFQGKSDAKAELANIVIPLLRSGEASAISPEGESDTKLIEKDISPERAAPGLSNELLFQTFTDSELVIALVGAVGTELGKVVDILRSRLATFGYACIEIHSLLGAPSPDRECSDMARKR
ncbi:MAG: hypothetical protein P4L43_02030 [Syntrophobacteraceae bacterium]|nr:hypothetical protein [Syntrophobacteraceae bacterium]